MKTIKYDIDYFIKKFKAIHHSRWTTKEFEVDGKYCAYGHCGVTNREGNEEGVALSNICQKYDMSFVHINDGISLNYKQKTPRARVLAALNDIKLKQTNK